MLRDEVVALREVVREFMVELRLYREDIARYAARDDAVAYCPKFCTECGEKLHDCYKDESEKLR